MIDTLSRKLALNIKNVVPDHPRSVEVLAFSISFVFSTMLVIIFALAISLVTSRLSETILALISYAGLRIISGGSHLKSGTLCILASTAGITLISFSNFDGYVINIMTLTSIILCLLYSPSKLEGTRIPVKYYPWLKVVSVLLVSSNFFIGSSVIASAFFIQSLSLIRIRR